MLRQVRWLLLCSLWLICPRVVHADISETLTTPLAGTPAQAGLGTAVFYGVATSTPSSAAVILNEVQELANLPYYAFQDVGINARLTSHQEFYYYPDSTNTTASFFLGDATGIAATDLSQWDNCGADFVGYINFPVIGVYTIVIGYADDFLGIFLNGNGTPGSGDFVAVQNYYGLFPAGGAGVTNTASVTVNTAGWYPYEMANVQGFGGANMDVQITGPGTVQFGSDANHWTSFVPPTPLLITPAASYKGPPGLAAAVWHNAPVSGAGAATIDPLIAYANSTSANYVFLDPAADANFYTFGQLSYNTDNTPYTVGGFVINGSTGLAINDAASLDQTMIDFAGWMYVPITGTYYLNLYGDDAAALFFGGTGPVGSGNEWIRDGYNGSPGYTLISTSIQAGWYPIEILWAQGGGSDYLTLTYSGPGKIHLAADANRWNGSVSGLSLPAANTATTSSWISGFAASVYHLANSYASGAALDATILPSLLTTMQSMPPAYRFFATPEGNPNGLYYRGNEAEATNNVLGSYAQGSATTDTTAIGSTIIDHQGWVYFSAAGYQWIFFDAATDFGAIYLGGNGTPGTGQKLLSGSFNDAPGVGAWGRVNIASPGWYPIEVLWLSRYDCGASCNANLILSAWGPGAINFAAAPIYGMATPPAASGLLASVYRLSTPLPIGSDAYSISLQLTQVAAQQPNYTFLDPTGATAFNLAGTDSTPLNTFLGSHASGLATADSNALGATIIDFKGAVVFSQAGNYTFALTAADDAAVLLLGQEPNAPLGQIVMERNLTGTLTSAGSLSSPLTLQVNTAVSHSFELIYYNSGAPLSTNAAALAMSITGPAPVAFAAPLNKPVGQSVCGNFNAYIPATMGVVDVANYGALPNDGVDDYAAIQLALASLTSNQTLLFHAGNYNIAYSELGTIATLNNLSDIDISGNGANFVISGYNIDTPATPTSFFNVTGCDHVTIHDLSIDMARPPFSYGLVTSTPSSNSIRVTFDSTPAVDASLLIAAITQYDGNNLPLAQDLDDYYYDNTSLFSATQSSAQHLVITLTARSDTGVEIGDYVMVRHAFREQPAFLLHNSNDIALGNITVYAAPGDGIQANMVNTLYVQNVNLRNGAGRHMSVTGHGIEAHGTTGGLNICGSSIEGVGGDGILTVGQPGSVTAVSRSSLTVSTNANFQQAPFRVGDEIRVFSPTGANRGSGYATAASVIDDTQTSNTLVLRFVPRGTAVGDTVVAYNRDTNINIRYSAIAHNSGRGVGLANGGVLIDHTQIQGTTKEGIQCYADLMNTAPACDRVLLSNNNLHNVGLSNNQAATSFKTYCNNALCPNMLTKSITLQNNAFDNTAGRAAEFASVYGFTMKNNALNQIANVQPPSSTSAVDIQQSTLGFILGNSVQNSSTLAVSQTANGNVTISNNAGTW